jgi:hypothetical protein
MNPLWAFLVYSASIALALLLVYVFPVRWYWHAASVVAAFVIGLIPIPPEWSSPEMDLTIGFLFVLLFVWGIGEAFFTTHHYHHRHRPHHA